MNPATTFTTSPSATGLDLQGNPADLAKRLDPHELANALSNLCRFNGHVAAFYSVAQHCCLVHDLIASEEDELRLRDPRRSEATSRAWARAGLLHDAAEALGLGDHITQLKRLIGEPVRIIEDRLEEAVAIRFGLPVEWLGGARVKRADRIALWTEMRDVRGRAGRGMTIEQHVRDGLLTAEQAELQPQPPEWLSIIPVPPRVARVGFLKRLSKCWPSPDVRVDWTHP